MRGPCSRCECVLGEDMDNENQVWEPLGGTGSSEGAVSCEAAGFCQRSGVGQATSGPCGSRASTWSTGNSLP